MLMYDIGLAVNMSYHCSGSGSNTQAEVIDAFDNTFGYSSPGQYYNYDASSHVGLIRTELYFNRPVIFRGGEESPSGTYINGHAWVCDGYQFFRFCDPNYTMSLLHMNWGWVNAQYNGYYEDSYFDPGNFTFNYKVGLIAGIHP